MVDGVILIQSCEVEVQGSLAFVTSRSMGRTVVSAMERGAMREYLERARRILDDADDRDRFQLIQFPDRAAV